MCVCPCKMQVRVSCVPFCVCVASLLPCPSSCANSGSKYAGPAFSAKNAIKSVGFNINPDYPKLAPRVSSAPFEITRTMRSHFPADMLIELNPACYPADAAKKKDFNKMRIGYIIQHGTDGADQLFVYRHVHTLR